MGIERWRFERVGLGYRVTADDIQTEMRVTRLKRSSGELHAELRVTANMKNVKTNNGVLHVSRMNLSSSTARDRMATLLGKRTSEFPKMDWFDGLEVLCQDVMVAESTGEPYLKVGRLASREEEELYLIDPVIPANVPSITYAEGGSGKSVLALANALAVKTGWQFIPGMAPTTTGNVLYLDWETNASVVNRRIRRIADGAGQEPPDILYRRCIRPVYEEAEEIANYVAENGVIFLVIDSAGMAMGGAGERGDANENTLRMFDALRHIGATTQIIDHVSKQEMKGKGKVIRGRLPYGSIYKINMSRSAWEIRTTVDEENEDLIRVTFMHVKANDSKLHDDINIEVNWVPGGPIRFLAADTEFESALNNQDLGVAEAIVAVLADMRPKTRTAVANEVPKGIKRDTVFKTITRLIDKGQLVNGQGLVGLPPEPSGQPGGHDKLSVSGRFEDIFNP